MMKIFRFIRGLLVLAVAVTVVCLVWYLFF